MGKKTEESLMGRSKRSVYCFSVIFTLALLTAPPVFSEEEVLHSEAVQPSYQIVEDKATLPILNPTLEGRSVEKLKLANGLKVLLISDPGVDQSAAGVAVGVGSWDDPKEYPGMAHFCEHMLFMGTKSHPAEFEYMHYVFDHGGKVNAFTAPDRTVYMFSINNDAFESCLDKFSHFFIDPLFSPNCINRELLAVDQEHAKNIENDGYRHYMILKETGNPDHPSYGFCTGNAATLSGIPQSALRTWYETHYSANNMCLSIVSPLPLDELKTLAVQYFSNVPNVNAVKTELPAQFTSPNQRGHMIFIKPVKDIKQLSLAWEIPAEFALDNERKAPELVAYALGEEGPNSLANVLKEEKIAEGLAVSVDRFSKNSVLFNIDIALTEHGITQIDTAIMRVFQAVARLKEQRFPSYLFIEAQSMAKLNYQYQSREDAFDAIMELSSEMVYEELETYPIKTKIPMTFDPGFIHAFVETLKPDDCLFFVIANPSKTGIPTDVKEKWLNAEYSIKEIAQNRLTAWADATPIAAIQLPANNPYIPTNLNLVPMPEGAKAQEIPVLITSDESCKVYFVQDMRYHVPEASLLFTFKSPLLDNSAKSCALSDLYVRAITEKLSAPLSLASSAGLSARFFTDDYALKLGLNGYSDKAPLLLDHIFTSLKSFVITKEEFEIYRTSLASDYDNASKELPYRQAMEELDSILFNTPTNSDKLAVNQSLTFEEFSQFSHSLFQESYTEALFYGNFTEKQASRLWTHLKTKLGSKPFAPAEQYKKQVLLLSEKYGPYKIMQNTDRQGSGVLLLLQEGNFSFGRSAVQKILGTALKEGFFETLRTKQQTAYIAQAWNLEERRQLLQFFAVQSSTHTPTDLLARFELFLESFDKNLATQIPEGRFESIRANLITLLKMPPENMPGMAAQLNQLAFEYNDFDWIAKKIEGLKEMSYEQFCDEAHELLSRNNPRRLAVLVEGTISPENDFHYELITKEDVSNLGTFVTVTK